MKRCPQCNRTYTDDALSFCLDDGSPLAVVSGPPPADPSATLQYPQARDTTPQPTIAYNPGQATPPPLPPPTPPPAWSPMPPPQTQKRSVWPWLLGIGAVLFLMAIGVIVLIIMVARVTNDNNGNRVANNSNNSNNANSKSANRNRNTNSDNTNDNTNTSSTPSSFTDDFSAQTWGTGTWDDGRAWYSDEEYHMHAISGRFIEMYAPEKSEYYTKDATVKVGLRSIDGNPPSTGYGMVVHGAKNKKDGSLEDYGFLIFNGPEPKYKIILHKAGVETNIVSWTSSSVIRTGTSPNQIEVRISGPKLDLYINGQFINSITDSAGYKTGRVGFYTSDAGEVAFDDLEINR
jgi:hypothetical protein